MDNQETSIDPIEEVTEENTEVVTPEQNEDLKNISADLKEFLEFIKTEKAEEKEKAEAEKQIQIETENQQVILDEEERLKLEEKEQIEMEQQQRLFESVDAQTQKMDTYIEISDGLLKSFEAMNAKTELLIENTTVEEQSEQDDMSFYADITLVMICWVFLPLYISYRMIKPLFNKIF